MEEKTEKNKNKTSKGEKSLHKSKKNKAYATKQKTDQASSTQRQKVITFECSFIEDMMKSDDKFEGREGQNVPQVFVLNQCKVRSALGHPEVIIGIPVKLGSCMMIALSGFVL